MGTKKRTFIKYGNRKLHERGSEVSYVSMADLGDLIASDRGAVEVEVVDDATGEDLTLVTLARIFYERCKTMKVSCDPTDLRRLIVASAGSRPR